MHDVEMDWLSPFKLSNICKNVPQKVISIAYEEYERRVKKSKQNGNGSESDQEINLFSAVSVFVRNRWRLHHGDDDGSSWIMTMKNFGEEEKKKKITELFNFNRVVMEPKTQISLSAINGFFSA
ncbi:hypothetical protein LOK49_LG01G02396 [Camellia lanceoleosa]|uniref:Uncharacterized protein n=1 Tax=Camellia lanceoleosa TaxID=1840588 RepID=A0ACC0J4C8_9ERIC|nr:hypothetical protein LOK49_LG01G02396 [Camellia lanceoleosa]